MTSTIARIKREGKNYEILVDMDLALKFRNGEGSSSDFLEFDEIFTDSKKGFKASDEDLKKAFGTLNVNEIAEKIVKSGEVLVTQEHRDEKQQQKFKQVVDFLVRNTINPQTGNPHTEERIKSAMEQSGVNIKNVPVENQIIEIVEKISQALPIKIQKKKIKITTPAISTGQVYGIISPYKESENWLNNGDLEVIVNVPSGIINDFFDKLNSVTHGSAMTEEIKDSGDNFKNPSENLN
jgi:ribosome maturation protein SDO1